MNIALKAVSFPRRRESSPDGSLALPASFLLGPSLLPVRFAGAGMTTIKCESFAA